MSKRKRIYYLSKDQIDEGVRLCVQKIRQILDDIEILCKNGGDETTAVFLYTIALEEFGKSLLLKECLNTPIEPKGIPVSLNLFQGVEGHDLKIGHALDVLPEECQIYQDVNLLDEGHKLPPEHRKYARDAPKLQEAFQKLEKEFPNGRFLVGSFALPFDFATRKNLLYVNWDPENKRWNDDVTIDPYKIIEDYDGGEREVEKNEEEIYPEKILIAIESFRECLSDK